MTANRAASIRAGLKQHTDTSKQDFNLTLTRYGAALRNSSSWRFSAYSRSITSRSKRSMKMSVSMASKSFSSFATMGW